MAFVANDRISDTVKSYEETPIRAIRDAEQYFNQTLQVSFFLFYLASPQEQGHHNSVSQLPWARITYPLSTFPVGGNRSTRRKPTNFGRVLTKLFSPEDWARVHIKVNLTGDRTRNLRGEREVVGPLHHQSL